MPCVYVSISLSLSLALSLYLSHRPFQTTTSNKNNSLKSLFHSFDFTYIFLSHHSIAKLLEYISAETRGVLDCMHIAHKIIIYIVNRLVDGRAQLLNCRCRHRRCSLQFFCLLCRRCFHCYCLCFCRRLCCVSCY